MFKYKCQHCGYIYDPEKGEPSSAIFSGNDFISIPNNWICPQCGKKESF